jgi:hypothetical protein
MLYLRIRRCASQDVSELLTKETKPSTDEVIEQTFRNASIDGGNRALWVQ